MASRVDSVPFQTARAPRFDAGRLLFAFGLTFLAIAAFAAAFALGYARLHEGRILPGVEVAGVNVSGLTLQGARERLSENLPDLSKGALVVRAGETQELIRYSEFNRDYDLDYMLAQALEMGRADNFVEQLREQMAVLMSGSSVQPVMTWDAEALSRRVAAIAAGAQVEPVNATVSREDGHYLATPASPGMAVDVDAAVRMAMDAVNNLSAADTQIVVGGTEVLPQVSTDTAQAAVGRAEQATSTGLTVSGEELSATIDPDTLRGWLHLDEVGVGQWQLVAESAPTKQWASSYGLEVDTPATNATFAFSGGQLNVVPSTPGRAVDPDATAANVFAALQARVDGQAGGSANLALVPVEPTLTTAQAQAIAPRVEKLSEWTTRYVPGPLNGGGVNIQIPTNELDGYVLNPGEQFDFLTAIGPITSPPYETGGILLHGQIKEDGAIGGGMCSVSTTLFNAALRYGLQVWARGNHSIYISRYPIGLDATVWMTGPKNRRTMGFTNDTPYPIVIRGINSPGAVTFEIWGVDDGRTVELGEPRIENAQAPTYRFVEYTDELAPGRREVKNDAYDAFDSWVTRIVRNAAGEILYDETYQSHYKMLPAYARVGRSPGDPASGKIVSENVAPDPNPGPI